MLKLVATSSEPDNPKKSTDRIEAAELACDKARSSLIHWCCLVDESFEVPSHIKKLAMALESVERRDTQRLMVMMPPRHGKSLLSSVRFPSWWMGRNGDERVICASHTASLAYTFSRRCRNELDEYGGPVFGVHMAGDSSAVDKWNLNGRNGGLVAAGIGGPLTGHGADLLFIDDPVKDSEAAHSQAQRDSTHEWYRSVARTRLHPNGCIVLVMTRWHEDDLAGRLLREAEDGGEKWEVVRMPMVDKSGKLLWPERFNADWTEKTKRAIGSRAWESLYQQQPSPDTGGIFKSEWWRRYDKRPECKYIWQSWDMSFKGGENSSYVVGQTWGRLGGDRYLLDQVRGQWDFTRTLVEVQRARDKWTSPYVFVEDKANGPAVIAVLRDKIDGLIPVEPSGSKEARASAVSPLVEAGQVWIPSTQLAAWADDFLHETTSFPYGTHDDQVDAMTQALTKEPMGTYSPKFRRIERAREMM